MEIHNTTEDIVFAAIGEICTSIEKQGNPEKLCLCDQCRIDAACFVLNRVPPHYIISNRGAARIEQETISRQQQEADAVSLVFEALKRVSHNQRPNSDHTKGSVKEARRGPVFNIPTIIGRAFDGANFSPLADVGVELWRDGKLVEMKNRNWQNPCKLVLNTQGTFTFWPESIPAKEEGSREQFEYSVKIEVPGFETMTHFFEIPVISELGDAGSFSMDRTIKLPDLYLFPPGGDED
ncbi:late competence development ComFB family protein [Treponema primitia]|uniref:late competence development ComFB family protein n=1 Tax=Treponema primitia TaxID=88058 RepID=UPI0039818ED9